MTEDNFHAVVACPAAAAVWDAMGTVWSIPAKESILNTGSEWLFDLLITLSEEVRARVVMIIWRNWQMRNDALHDKIPASVEATKVFLQSYMLSLE